VDRRSYLRSLSTPRQGVSYNRETIEMDYRYEPSKVYHEWLLEFEHLKTEFGGVAQLEKLEVARRQLREVIWMFFHERDAISIHTLVAAAHQILDDLARQKGLPSIRHNPLMHKDKKKIWINNLNRIQNFFKHADRNPQDKIMFHPAISCYFITDAIQLYNRLSPNSPLPEAVLYIVLDDQVFCS
jgi:hypothetical protein